MKLSEAIREGTGNREGINESTHSSLLKTKYDISRMEMYHFPVNLYPMHLDELRRKYSVADIIWKLRKEADFSKEAIAMWVETLENYLEKLHDRAIAQQY